MDTIPQDTPQKQCSKCKNFFPATNAYFFKDKQKRDGFRPRCKECTGNKTLGMEPRGRRENEIQCTKCKKFLPATTEFFYVRKNAKSGWYPWCKECSHEQSKTHRDADRETVRIQSRQQHTKHRDKINARKRKYRQENKEVINARRRANHAIDPERRRASYRKAYQRNKEHIQMQHLQYHINYPEVARAVNARRRARRRAIPGTLTSQQIQQKLKAQHYRCYYAACGYAEFEKVNGKYIYHLEHTIPVSRTEASPRHDVNFIVLACPACNQSKHNKLPHEWPEGGRLF